MVDCSWYTVGEPSCTLKDSRLVCVNKILTALERQRERRRRRENTHPPTQRKHKHAVPMEMSPLLDYSAPSPPRGSREQLLTQRCNQERSRCNSVVNLEVITHLGFKNRLPGLMRWLIGKGSGCQLTTCFLRQALTM